MVPSATINPTPSDRTIVYYDKAHRYKIDRGEGMEFVPSVTTILDKALPKNLSGWAERGAIEGVQVLRSRGRDVTLMGPDAILDEMHAHGLRYYQRRDAAALRGTSVHNAFEQLSMGGAPRLTDYPVPERGYIQAITKWWLEHDPGVLYAEIMVGSWEHGFAGRMDLLAQEQNEVRVIDLKTSRAIRESHHFQTAAYKIGLKESGYPPAASGWILQVSAEGEFQYVESWATEDQFLALHKSYLAQREFEKATPAEHKYQRPKVKEKKAA